MKFDKEASLLVARLKAIKEREGKTLKELSEKIGAHEITICRWLTGAHPPQRGLVRRALAAFLAKEE